MSRTRATRPALMPGLPRLWRDPNRLQLGTDPEHAVILEFDEPASGVLLDLLDGSRTESGLVREASRRGVPADHVAAVLAALDRAGLLIDSAALPPRAPGGSGQPASGAEAAALALRRGPVRGCAPATALRRRSGAGVVVAGGRRLALPIATALATAGVGHLDLRGVDDAGEVAAAVVREAPTARLGGLSPRRASVAVLIGFAAPAALTALAYAARRLTHLAVTIRDGTVVIGPLVRPGQTPCLSCLDLHRLDRDPAWGAVAAQLHTAPAGGEPVAVTTAMAAAAYAAEEVLSHIDGEAPTTVGATVEISAPGRVARRQWSPHPRCGCRRRSRSRSAPPRSPPSECFN